MKITSFNGSPKGEKGNTHVMVKAFLEGAEKAGAEVENIFLAEKDIGNCRGCYGCWMKTPGECVLKDDMAELLEKFVSSDIVVYATPLFIDNVSGIMKNFMDRLIPVGDPHLEVDSDGQTRHPGRYEKMPDIVAISNCGFPEQDHFQVLKLLFRRIARNMHGRLLAELYISPGSIIANPPEGLAGVVESYLEMLKKAGKEIVEKGGVSNAILSQIAKPLVSPEIYRERGNQLIDKILSEGKGLR